jgi:hypothetical protein
VALQEATLEGVALSDCDPVPAGDVGGEVIAGFLSALIAEPFGGMLESGFFHSVHLLAPFQ